MTQAPSPHSCCNDIRTRAEAPVQTPAALLEARLETAGRRLSMYLRHMPLPERKRHELALDVLNRLAQDPGVNAAEAEERSMSILRSLLADSPVTLHAVPDPGLKRSHMRPEEMDRRPWVRAWMRRWHPLYVALSTFFNTSLLAILLYALLLAGLYVLGSMLL